MQVQQHPPQTCQVQGASHATHPDPEMLAILGEILDAGLVSPMAVGAPGSLARETWQEHRDLLAQARRLHGSIRAAQREAIAGVPSQYGSRHLEVIGLMEREGGSFASSLGRAWARADHENHARLWSAFGGLWADYAAKLDARRQATGGVA